MRMRVLIYSERPPLTRRASGDIRFGSLIKIVSGFSEVYFSTLPLWERRAESGEPDVVESFELLDDLGCVVRSDFLNLLREEKFDLVLFEFYDSALKLLDTVRFYQPHAHIVVDSVDLHFRRLLKKASVEGSLSSHKHAQKVKKEELAIYHRSDSVILLTQEDVSALEEEGVKVHTGLIPNIHHVPELVPKACNSSPSLIFVGGFKHAPNEDAVIYFANSIWPLIKAALPGAKIRVIGELPPDSVRQLQSADFEIMGHVPDLAPILFNSDISVAPLRWGGGIKGKVGEAMAFGLPVVTTPVGAEGFGIVSGKHAIVAESAHAFSDGIFRLVNDEKLYRDMREAAHLLIHQKFSQQAIEHEVENYFREVISRPTKKLALLKRLQFEARDFWLRHFAWRFD